jgi:hypothetical protein
MAAHALCRAFRCGRFALAAGAVLTYLCACGATEEAPKARIASPLEQQQVPAPSTHRAEETPIDKPKERVFDELQEEVTDALFPRPISKNVPSRTCTKDEECGDGFCDRTACARIWTWRAGIGQRCGPNTKVSDCGSRLCIDGRCRSCLFHAECPKEFGVCGSDGNWAGPLGNGCSGYGPKQVGLPSEPPPPAPLPVPSSTPAP